MKGKKGIIIFAIIAVIVAGIAVIAYVNNNSSASNSNVAGTSTIVWTAPNNATVTYQYNPDTLVNGQVVDGTYLTNLYNSSVQAYNASAAINGGSTDTASINGYALNQVQNFLTTNKMNPVLNTAPATS